MDGIARRMALMTAEAWMSYEDLGIEIERARSNRKRTSKDLARLRRRRQQAAGQFLAGLRTLNGLMGGNGDGGGLDLAAALAQQRIEA
jgi:hypothetical protein